MDNNNNNSLTKTKYKYTINNVKYPVYKTINNKHIAMVGGKKKYVDMTKHPSFKGGGNYGIKRGSPNSGSPQNPQGPRNSQGPLKIPKLELKLEELDMSRIKKLPQHLQELILDNLQQQTLSESLQNLKTKNVPETKQLTPNSTSIEPESNSQKAIARKH